MQRTRNVWQMMLSDTPAIPSVTRRIMSVCLRRRRLKSKCAAVTTVPFTECRPQRSSCQIEAEGGQSRWKEHEESRTSWPLIAKGMMHSSLIFCLPGTVPW